MGRGRRGGGAGGRRKRSGRFDEGSGVRCLTRRVLRGEGRHGGEREKDRLENQTPKGPHHEMSFITAFATDSTKIASRQGFRNP